MIYKIIGRRGLFIKIKTFPDKTFS